MSIHIRIFVTVLLLGVLAIFGYRFAQPLLAERFQKSTSDAAATHGVLRIGTDSWVGYFPLCSPEMARRMRAQGWQLLCEDDQADYRARMNKLAAGQLDLAVATVDSWLLNGAAVDFPATIVSVIDQSKGGDAIVARRSVIADLDSLKARPQTRIAFTPVSPSEHLLKSIGVHFGLPQLADRKGAWRLETKGSGEALAKLRSGDADVAVLWEPDVSRALAGNDFVKLIGTEDTQALIVDILLASRHLVQQNPDAVQTLLREYFDTLRYYREQPAQLRTDLARSSGLDEAQASALVNGVEWAGLDANGAEWFGITPAGTPAQESLARALEDTAAILVAAGDFPQSPIPERDPYRLTNRQFIAALYLPGTGSESAAVDFAPLDEAGWSRLTPVGTLKLEPVNFARGTATLDDDGRRALDAIAERLRQYPRYRLLIKGHTAANGDTAANLALSGDRARAALDYLIDTHGLDPDRLRAVGFGGSQPLPQLPGESERARAYRLPRVEFAMQAER